MRIDRITVATLKALAKPHYTVRSPREQLTVIDMFWFIPVFTVLFISSNTIGFKNELLFNGHGWVPLSKEEAMNKIGNNIHRINNNEQDSKLIWDYVNAEESRNMQILKDNAIKLSQPETFSFKPNLIQKSHDPFSEESIKFSDQFQQEPNICSKEDPSNYCNGTNIVEAINASSASIETLKHSPALSNKSMRRSKSIGDSVLLNGLRSDMFNDHETYNVDAKPKHNEDSEQETRTSYEVIEDTQEIDTKLTGNNEKSTGYFYTPPVVDIQNNLTSTLFNILNRYNIRPQDQIANYAYSRRKKSGNSLKNNYNYIPIPLRMPHSYNSQNHLPIDPLIAVYLSNYGYYLPGMYGRKHNYGNLYGYLASNNIHNNMPFGFYKIFSDTDSSN